MKLQTPLPVTFQEQAIPPNVRLVGAAAIAHELSIAAPVRRPSCVAEQHVGGSRRRDGVVDCLRQAVLAGRQLG